jgi:hypothetical protein
MTAEGRMDDVLYQGSHDIVYFLNWVRSLRVFYGAFKDTVIIGGGWVDVPYVMESQDRPYKKAEIGFGFSKKATIFEGLVAGRKMLERTFNFYDIDFVYGTTPESNKLALGYAKRLGFQLHGPIPNSCVFRGKLEGTYTSYLDKELLNGRSEKKEN